MKASCARLAAGGAALIVFTFSLWFLPPKSDGAIAIQDGIWYGQDAQTERWQTIHPHHPLFHVVASALTEVLERAGCAEPGHVAVRIMSAAGAAWCVALIVSLAGARWWLGLVAAGFVVSARIFLIEGAVGETNPLGAAVLLWMLRAAAAEGASLVPLVLATVIALLFRQDNIVALPAVGFLLWTRWPAGRRERALATWLVLAGLLTVLGYYGAWCLDRTPHEPFVDYVLRFARKGPWPSYTGETPRVVAMADALSSALIGRQWPLGETRPLLGFVALFGLGAGARMWRGSGASRRFVLALGAVVLLRLPLFLWFEPQNPEWQIAPLLLASAAAASVASGASLGRRPAIFGAGTVLLTIFSVLTAHAPTLPRLREQRVVESITAVRQMAPEGCRIMAYGATARGACALLGFPWKPLPGDELSALTILGRELLAHPVPTLVVADRFAIDGMPETFAHPELYLASLDTLPAMPGVRPLRYQGFVVGLLCEPVR